MEHTKPSNNERQQHVSQDQTDTDTDTNQPQEQAQEQASQEKEQTAGADAARNTERTSTGETGLSLTQEQTSAVAADQPAGKQEGGLLEESSAGTFLSGEVTEEPDETPPLKGSARRTVLIGLGVMFLFFVGLGSWAMLAPLDSAVIAPGSIVVKGNRKEVQHRDGGFVDEIPVSEGDFVQAGDVLVRLDDTEIRSTIDRLQAQLVSNKARVARLQAEQQDAQQVPFPQDLLNAQDDPYVQTVLREERALFRNRVATLRGEIELLQQRIVQLEAQLEGYQAQADAHATQVDIIGRQLENFRGLEQKGFESTLKVLDLERQQATYIGQRGEASADLAKTRETIGELRLQIAQLQRRRAEEIAQGLREGHAKIAELEPQLRSARKQLERVELRAPKSGYVLNLSVFAEGSVVKPGEKVLEIVPADELLIVEAKVRPADITDIEPGMQADVRITAYTQRDLPAAEGIVRTISADRITEERSGNTYYLTRVEIVDEEFLELQEVDLYPGMPAEVMIPTGSRTAFDYLIEPLTRRFQHAFKEK